MMLFFWFSLKKDEFYNKYKNILTFFFRSTTSTTTTATEAIETQNEVIRSRSRSPNSDRGGRVKIRVRQKKRPFTTTAIPTTISSKTLPDFAGGKIFLLYSDFFSCQSFICKALLINISLLYLIISSFPFL